MTACPSRNKDGLTWGGNLKSLIIGFLTISFVGGVLAHDAYPGKKEPTRYSAVAIDKRTPGVLKFRFAKDRPPYFAAGVHPAAGAWRDATNKCGGVSLNCYVVRSWGNH